MNDEVDFLHAGRHENLLQIDTMILMEIVKHLQGSQNSKFTMSEYFMPMGHGVNKKAPTIVFPNPSP